MSTITTLLDWIAASLFRSQINTNFANLNSTKKEDSMSTNKLLWRNTAGTGVIEEITLGTNLSMTGTTLNVTAWSGDMVLASVQTNSALKTFLDATFWLRNVANTFTSFFTNTNTASRTYTLPDASDTLVWRATTDTLTNKTISVGTFTGTQTFSNALINTNNAVTASAGAATVPVTARTTTVTNNAANALTITITTSGAVDGQLILLRIYDFSAVAQTLTFVNTENSDVSVPATTNGSTTLPRTVGFQYNSASSKWRCLHNA